MRSLQKDKKGMAFEGGQAIKFLLGEMFTEINLLLSTLGYYRNTYGNWHSINGALNQEFLEGKHTPNFPANLDKKPGMVKLSNTSGFMRISIYWHLSLSQGTPAPSRRWVSAMSTPSTTTDTDLLAVKAQ